MCNQDYSILTRNLFPILLQIQCVYICSCPIPTLSHAFPRSQLLLSWCVFNNKSVPACQMMLNFCLTIMSIVSNCVFPTLNTLCYMNVLPTILWSFNIQTFLDSKLICEFCTLCHVAHWYSQSALLRLICSDVAEEWM